MKRLSALLGICGLWLLVFGFDFANQAYSKGIPINEPGEINAYDPPIQIRNERYIVDSTGGEFSISAVDGAVLVIHLQGSYSGGIASLRTGSLVTDLDWSRGAIV